MRVFEARFPGKCGTCGEKIEKGSAVSWEDNEVVHATCPDSPVGLTARAVCGRCFQEKSVVGTCGCVE